MIADLKPYPALKPSGVPWLGEVPEHWERNWIRNLCELRVSNVDKHVKPGQQPVRLCNYVDVYANDEIDETVAFGVASATEAERRRFQLRRGDVLITKDSESWTDIAVPALVRIEERDIVCGYHLAILRPRLATTGAFLRYVILARPISAQFHVRANGVTRYGLSQGQIRAVQLVVPPLDEQEGIVRFLDWVDRRIGRAVGLKEREIALLEEQKQAIITEAVTRGLDKSVALKPSDVPWLGEVPEHWQLFPNRAIVKRRKVFVGARHSEYTLLSLTKRGLVVRDLTDLKGKFSADLGTSQEVREGDIVFCLFDVPETPRTVALAAQDGMITGAYTVFEFLGVPSRRYFELFYRAIDDRKLLSPIYSGLRNTIQVGRFMTAKTPQPPLEEQEAIVRFLDVETARIDRAGDRLRREIDLLGEYWTRLISDVVTGKLDVREAAKGLPEQPEDLEDSEADAGGQEPLEQAEAA